METTILVKELETLVRELKDEQERARWKAVIRVIQIAVEKVEKHRASRLHGTTLQPEESFGEFAARIMRERILRDHSRNIAD